MTETRDFLTRTADLAATFLDSLEGRPVGGPVDLAALRQRMGGPVSSWKTSEDDIDRSAAAILRCLAEVDAAGAT